MHGTSGLNRRELGLLAANIGLLTLGGRAFAQEPAKAMLGHFPSANQQNFSKATGSMQKAMGAKARVEYVGVTAGPQILTAMAGNSMDLCNIGSSPMVVGFTQGLPISMVYVHKVIKDDECLMARGDSGIKGLADLKGRKIGCPFNSSAHFALLAALKTVRLTPSDLQLVNLKSDGIVPAWQRKDIDAAYIWNPVLPKLAAEGGVVIFRSGDLIASGTVIFDGIVVREEFKQKHPDLVLIYLKELDRINGIYREQPAQVAEVMAPYLQLPPETALTVAKSTHTITPREMLTDTWMGAPGAKKTGVLDTLMAQAEFLKNADQVKAIPPDLSRFVDSSFVAKMV
ncbi:taurine ABC transporter substrate-binding protein [Variovorax defluvii]|uniref:Taurine ABC transporter substrate-binding protein n=1 Tax=Variovorax defluvii TaxID=913761 RepID=A0ABP8II71_9BURK